MTTIGVIGAGHIGGQVARAMASIGNDVVVSSAAGPVSLAGLVQDIGPHAQAATVAEAAAAGNIVVVAVPLAGFADVPAEPLEGKIVICTTNYNPRRDGHVAELAERTGTAATILQARLPKSRVVQAFSMLSAADVTTGGTPAGTPNRRALAIAGDDPDAKQAVAGRQGRA